MNYYIVWNINRDYIIFIYKIKNLKGINKILEYDILRKISRGLVFNLINNYITKNNNLSYYKEGLPSLSIITNPYLSIAYIVSYIYT